MSACSVFFPVTLLGSSTEISFEGHLGESFIFVHFPAVISKTITGRNTESQKGALTSTYRAGRAPCSAKEPKLLSWLIMTETPALWFGSAAPWPWAPISALWFCCAACPGQAAERSTSPASPGLLRTQPRQRSPCRGSAAARLGWMQVQPDCTQMFTEVPKQSLPIGERCPFFWLGGEPRSSRH